VYTYPSSSLLLLPAGSAAGSSTAGIVFTHVPVLGIKFGMEVLTVGRSSMPNFTLIGSGVGFTAPKTEKNWNLS